MDNFIHVSPITTEDNGLLTFFAVTDRTHKDRPNVLVIARDMVTDARGFILRDVRWIGKGIRESVSTDPHEIARCVHNGNLTFNAPEWTVDSVTVGR